MHDRCEPGGENSAGVITKSATIENNTFTDDWKIKDLSAIKKSLGCLGVLGNNFLKAYKIYFVPQDRTIYFY